MYKDGVNMKNGKRLTKKQKIFLKAKGLNSDNWLVCKDTSQEMVLQNKISGNVRQIRKVVSENV